MASTPRASSSPAKTPPNTGNSLKPTRTPTILRSPDEHFHVDSLIRADWHKRRLQRVEADLYRTILSESATPNLAAALLADTPATRLLTRIQRQLAAHDRAWYRALRELRRLREQTGQAEDRALDALLALPRSPTIWLRPPKKPPRPRPRPRPRHPTPPFVSDETR